MLFGIDIFTLIHFCQIHEMVLFGLKLIDEHASQCSSVLKSLVDANKLVEELFCHLRLQWLSYSIRKSESRIYKGVDYK